MCVLLGVQSMYSCGCSIVFCRVNPVQCQVELSLRLSHTDPSAAKRERKKADRERAGGGTEAKVAASSDEESSTDSTSERYRTTMLFTGTCDVC